MSAGSGPRATVERWLAKALRPFAQVQPGEAVGAVVLTLGVLLLLSAYYLLETAREPLILLHGGAEVKQYAAAGQAVLLVVVVNAYSALARRVGR
jgi:AAA family ATP:ADP antiporter